MAKHFGRAEARTCSFLPQVQGDLPLPCVSDFQSRSYHWVLLVFWRSTIRSPETIAKTHRQMPGRSLQGLRPSTFSPRRNSVV